MEAVFAVTVGVIFACGIYMVFRRSLVKLVMGIVLLGHAANLLIFATAGLRRGAPPLVPEGATMPPPGVADPLPQALILTAIVISFGVAAFLLVLFQRTYNLLGTDDMDQMRSTDA